MDLFWQFVGLAQDAVHAVTNADVVFAGFYMYVTGAGTDSVFNQQVNGLGDGRILRQIFLVNFFVFFGFSIFLW